MSNMPFTFSILLLAGACALVSAVAPAPAPGMSAAAMTSPLTQSPQDSCAAKLGGTDVTLIMVADPGDFSGTGEAVHYLSNLQGRVNVTGSSFCLSLAYGSILGSPVLVVASGIGPGTAALCTMELLQCSDYIKEIIWTGTAGYSAQQGGVIDTMRGCQANPSTAVTREGDLCITPWAINWDCKLTDWDQQCAGFPNICSDPTNEDGPEVASLFGECIFSTYTEADLELTMEIQAAAETASYPARSASITQYEEEYWNLTSNSTGVTYDLNRPVQAWNYTQCAIADSQFFWAGAPWDMVSRNYSAVLVNEALGLNLTQLDMVSVSSEEDIGLVQVLNGWNTLVGSAGKQVPYTIVRTHSDILHRPVQSTGNGTWVTASQDLDQNFEDGFAFAIATGSTAVLVALQNRCHAANGVGAAVCNYALAPTVAS